MINIKIITVGNLKEKFFIDACKEYEKRLNGLCNLSLIEIKEYKLNDNPNENEILKCLDFEAKEISKNISGHLVVLAIEGKQITSESFGEYIETLALSGESTICFVIGSSHGLSQEIKNKANLLLSFSKFTFPHRLMKVILLEQIYRAFSIIKNTKYHK